MKTFQKEQVFSGRTGISIRSYRDLRDDMPEHLHDFIELVYILSGSGVHGINGVEYTVSRGSMLFINYRQVHSFQGEMDYVNILIDPHWISEKLIDTENAFELLSLSAFNDFQSLCEGRALLRFEGAERTRMERLLEEMECEYARKDAGFETMLKAQANILLTLIFRKMLPKVDNPDLAEYIRSHSDEKLTLELLAKKSFYNPSYFSRLFRELYGMTVTEYIHRARIDNAKILLKTTARTVDEIAESVGYSGKTAFYKKFAEFTGQTPKQYRESKE